MYTAKALARSFRFNFCFSSRLTDCITRAAPVNLLHGPWWVLAKKRGSGSNPQRRENREHSLSVGQIPVTRHIAVSTEDRNITSLLAPNNSSSILTRTRRNQTVPYLEALCLPVCVRTHKLNRRGEAAPPSSDGDKPL